MAVDPSVYVAPTARVHPDANIGAGTRVGEYCVIEGNVTIGRECLLEPYVFVKQWTTLGDGNQISAGTVLGTDTLDRSFTGERSYLVIGKYNKNVVQHRNHASRICYRSGLMREEALAMIDLEPPSEHTHQLTPFIRGSKRGI